MTADHPSDDLASTLRAVGEADDPTPVVEAAFFHRTLARWLGLPEGKVDGVLDPTSWDYRYWRADLIREADRDSDGRLGFAATLASTETGPTEHVKWWVTKDARGRITDAGWDSDPPRLLDDPQDADAGAHEVVAVDDATMLRLFSDDDA